MAFEDGFWKFQEEKGWKEFEQNGSLTLAEKLELVEILVAHSAPAFLVAPVDVDVFFAAAAADSGGFRAAEIADLADAGVAGMEVFFGRVVFLDH